MGGVLFFGSVALANIIVGTSTTGISNDLTLTQLTLTKPADSTSGNLLLAKLAGDDDMCGLMR